MILTVTLNTSIDKAYTVEGFEAGRVHRVKGVSATAGGKGINVAMVVTALGEEVAATGFVGGYSGEFIKRGLDQAGIKNEFVDTQGETRTCINIIDETTGLQTELLEPGPLLNKSCEDRFNEKYESLLGISDVIVISGSMPGGIRPDFYARLVSRAKQKGIEVILDTSGRYLKEGMAARPTVIMPNKSEAEGISGRKINEEKDILEIIETFMESGIEMPFITLGEKGGYASMNGDIYRYIPPKIKTANAVGCGDAMAAGLAVAVCRGYTGERALRLAAATSSANAMTKVTGCVQKKDVERLFDKVDIKKLS